MSSFENAQSPEDSRNERDNAFAALARAALGRIRRAGKLPSRTVATATDRLATVLDVTETVAAKGGLRALMGGGAWAFAIKSGSVAVSLGKATAAGTVLFSAFDAAMAFGAHAVAPPAPYEPPLFAACRAAASTSLPFLAGAAAGTCFGVTTAVLDAVTAGAEILPLRTTLARRLRSMLRELPPTIAASAFEWGMAFGWFVLLRRALQAESRVDVRAPPGTSPSSTSGISDAEQSRESMSLTRAAALATAAVGGGVAQVAAAGVAAGGWRWRSAWQALSPKAVGVASVGLAAYELAHLLDDE